MTPSLFWRLSEPIIEPDQCCGVNMGTLVVLELYRCLSVIYPPLFVDVYCYTTLERDIS